MFPGDKDTIGRFFERIDADLAPFLETLDEGKDNPRTPVDIISNEAREMLERCEHAFANAILDTPRVERVNLLNPRRGVLKSKRFAEYIEDEVPGVKFSGSENVGFFVVPGVQTKLHPDDVRRPLVVTRIDFTRASREELAMNHFHVGAEALGKNGKTAILPAEYAEVWRFVGGLPNRLNGLVWGDENGELKTHFTSDKIRVAEHGSRDNYDAISDLSPEERFEKQTPEWYFGAYWGGIDMRSPTCPKIKTLKS